MMAKVEATLTPFLAFTFPYNAIKAHNMLALMLDSHFKSFDVRKVFVEWAKVIQIVAKYDNKILLPLLVFAFHLLNPTTNGLIKATPVNDDSIFWGGDFNCNHFAQVAKNDLGFFHHSHVKLKDYVSPLTWWKSHEA
jgi:hypothetical protein